MEGNAMMRRSNPYSAAWQHAVRRVFPRRLRSLAGWLIAVAFCTGAMARAMAMPTEEPAGGDVADDFPPAVLVVVGAGGEAQYEEAFALWGTRLREVADAAGAQVTTIGLEREPAGEDKQGESDQGESDGPTDRERLRRAIADVSQSSRQSVWLFLVGHGTSGAGGTKFNLRGPDVSAAELADWLQPIDVPVVVVAAFSSSAPLINSLSAPNRVVVTATQSGQEQNFSRFGDYFSQALGDPEADIDHDGEVSILEAFLAASAGVRDFYRGADRLQTETALIDDNGDSLGTPAAAFRGVRIVAAAASPDRSLDGERAAGMSLAPAAVRLPLTAEERIERDELEAELRRLHARQASLTDHQYREAVLPKWIRLAQLYQAAQRRAEAAAKEPEQSPQPDDAGEDVSGLDRR